MPVEIDNQELEIGAEEHENASMLEEALSSSSSDPSPSLSPCSSALHMCPTSSGLSAMVREKVRKKVLENINKKLSFDCVDSNLFAVKQHDGLDMSDDKSGAFHETPESPDLGNVLIPLRRSASEPDLKLRVVNGRNVRYKPYDGGHSLTVTSTNSSNNIRHGNRNCERKDASPADNAVTGKYPPERVPLLFESLLPNNTSGRSCEDIPSTSQSFGNYSTGCPQIEAIVQPGHPMYLYMLKKQYSINHHFLHRVLLHHGQDPREIDLFHQRYLLKSYKSSLSDEDRVTQLLESQNKLFIRLVDLFSLGTSKLSDDKSNFNSGDGKGDRSG